MSTAQGWIDTDRQSVRDDVARLGLDAAVDYEMDLIAERTQDGDARWSGITREQMREALAAL